MNISVLLGTALLTAMGAALLRRYDTAYAMLISIAGGVVILVYAVTALSGLMDSVNGLMNRAGLNRAFLTLLVKAMGICYLCRFGADLCRDAHETALAGHVELAGTILTVIIAFPMIREVAQTILKLIEA